MKNQTSKMGSVMEICKRFCIQHEDKAMDCARRGDYSGAIHYYMEAALEADEFDSERAERLRAMERAIRLRVNMVSL